MPISDDPAIMIGIAVVLWAVLFIHWAYTLRRR